MIKIGLIGTGHLGKIHLKLLKDLTKDFTIVGIYDSNPEVAKVTAEQFEVPCFDNMQRLIEQCDAVDIVTPTTSHFEIAKSVVRQVKHVFIEKPITSTVEEAYNLVELVKEAGVVAQVGHVERFNPAFLSVADTELNPMFIEVHRLAIWNPRGTDVSVVLDLMIHDIDIILHIVKSPIKNISASGVSVISDTPDIANARIEFHNGCVANLTASRISMKNMRKMRIFQKNAYLSVDFLEKQAEVFKIYSDKNQIKEDESVAFHFEETGVHKYLTVKSPNIQPVNSIQMELSAFAAAIRDKKDPPVTAFEAYEALQTAYKIVDKITPYSM